MGWCDSGLQRRKAFVGLCSHVRTAHQGPQCEVLESERDNGPLHYTEREGRGAQPGKGAKVSTVMQRLQKTMVISAELCGRASFQNLSL